MKAFSLKTAGPFLLLTFIYFIVGFLTTVNGQCQGPLKVAFLDAQLADHLHLLRLLPRLSDQQLTHRTNAQSHWL